MTLRTVPQQRSCDGDPSRGRDDADSSSILASASASDDPFHRPAAPDAVHCLASSCPSCSSSSADLKLASWISSHDMALLKARPSLLPPRLKILPRGTRPLRLVGEGAANAVFEFTAPRRACAASASDFKGLLLRVAKVPSPPCHAPAYDYLLQQDFYQSAIKPLLGPNAVHQELVVLRRSGIVEELNKLLRDINHLRRDKFKGSYIGHSDWGLLVQDMRPPEDTDDCLLIEFKPKWLSQSPSAPKAAVRCRQCALELLRFLNNPSRDRPLPSQRACPLTLANPNAPPSVTSPFRLAPQLAALDGNEDLQEALRGVANHPAIADLRRQQEQHDHLGPMRSQPSNPDFLVAMTLRDCTCFAQVHRRRRQAVKIRMGDFDWKDPRVKFPHWVGVEADLIRKGFYTSRWILCRGRYYRPPTLCLLETIELRADSSPHVLQILEPSELRNSPPATNGPQTVPNVWLFTHHADIAALEPLLDPLRVTGPDLIAPNATACAPVSGVP